MQPTLAEFRKYYNTALYPELVRLDYERKRLLRYIGLSVVLILLAIVFAQVVGEWLVTMLLVVPVGTYFSWLLWQYQQYRQQFKPYVVGLILDFLDEDPNIGLLHYDATKYIPKDIFLASKLFENKIDRYVGEDYISGTLGSLEFEMSELGVYRLGRVRNYMECIFRGVFLYARTSMPIRANLYLIPQHRKQYMSRTLNSLSREGLNDVSNELSNEAFVETFLIFADRNTLLHKLLLEELQRELLLYIEQTGKKIYFSFHNQKIYIAVSHDKDLLEPPLFSSVVSFELVREFFEDVRLLLRLIEILDQIV